MKILFTGGSSFTGYWFIKELHLAGHEVHATLQSNADTYSGIRLQRIEKLRDKCIFREGVSFGSRSFVDLIATENYDVICHHGADVKDYHSQSFNVINALDNNTKSISEVMEKLALNECAAIIVTGSVFECDEGMGSLPLEAFSPYGLSKSLTASVFRYWASHFGLTLGKFVIPNPFGPFEEARFTTYLAKTWFNNQTASVRTPDYVRDNIHVSLLAKEYVRLVVDCLEKDGFHRRAPTGYIGTQGAFAQKFSSELSARINRSCELDLQIQKEFSEPKARINTDFPDIEAIGWSEEESWDELAEYYLNQFGCK